MIYFQLFIFFTTTKLCLITLALSLNDNLKNITNLNVNFTNKLPCYKGHFTPDEYSRQYGFCYLPSRWIVKLRVEKKFTDSTKSQKTNANSFRFNESKSIVGLFDIYRKGVLPVLLRKVSGDYYMNINRLLHDNKGNEQLIRNQNLKGVQKLGSGVYFNIYISFRNTSYVLHEKTGYPLKKINSLFDLNVLTTKFNKSRIQLNSKLEKELLQRYDFKFIEEIKSVIKSVNSENDEEYSIKNVEEIVLNDFDGEESKCVYFDCTNHSSCSSFKGRATCRSKCMENEHHGCLSAPYCAQLGYDQPHVCEEYQEGGINERSKFNLNV